MVMLSGGLQFDEETTAYLRQAHLRPYPRVTEGQLLARHGVRAAIDVSDGLASDLAKLCKASKVGARLLLDQIPIHPSVRSSFRDGYLNMALAGGEDYELLFTGSTEVIDEVRRLLPCPTSVIGDIVSDEPGKVIFLDEHGRKTELEKEGWDHFAPKNKNGLSQPG